MPTTDSAQQITRDIAPMLRELTACRHLEDDDPRRVAALAEKHRLLDLIAETDGRRSVASSSSSSTTAGDATLA
jgi:hypothetical protein